MERRAACAKIYHSEILTSRFFGLWRICICIFLLSSMLHEINLQNNIFLREVRPRDGLMSMG